MKYERFTERIGKAICIKETSTNDNKSIWNAIERLAELEDKIENGTLMEINKPFIKTTKYGSYICKATVIVVEDFDTKAEAEAKLKELKGE